MNLRNLQGGHAAGKTGNLDVNFSRQGKHREFAQKLLVAISVDRVVDKMLYFEAKKEHREKVENTGNFDLMEVWPLWFIQPQFLPTTSTREGYVFVSVCHSAQGRGGLNNI